MHVDKYLGRQVSLDGFPKAGDRMRFLGRNGYPVQLEHALKHFEVGQELVVEESEVGGWETLLKFEGNDGWFNSVMFESCQPKAEKEAGDEMAHHEEHDPLITTDDESLLEDVLDAVKDYVLIQETNLRGEIVLNAMEYRIERLKAMRGVKDVLEDYIEKQVRRVVADMALKAAERGMSLEKSIKADQEDFAEECHDDHEEESVDETVQEQPRRFGMRPSFVRS